MKPREESLVRERLTAGVIVSHRVADYDAWKVAFDKDEDRRANAGIIGHAVNQIAADPKEVIIYLQAADADSIRNFVASPELKAKMQEAGVEGAPTIKFVEGQEWGNYA